MANDAAVLLVDSGQESRNVDQRDQRDVEAVAGSNEARTLVRRVDVQHTCQHLRLLRDDADASPFHPRESADDVARETRVDLQEGTGVDEPTNRGVHVV